MIRDGGQGVDSGRGGAGVRCYTGRSFIVGIVVEVKGEREKGLGIHTEGLKTRIEDPVEKQKAACERVVPYIGAWQAYHSQATP